MLILLNHALTEEQRQEAEAMGNQTFLSPSKEVQALWSNVDPHSDSLVTYLAPVFKWLRNNCPTHIDVLVQGEPGATFLAVQLVFALGGKPYYATTERSAIEVRQPDGSVKVERTFRHVRFRMYERLI